MWLGDETVIQPQPPPVPSTPRYATDLVAGTEAKHIPKEYTLASDKVLFILASKPRLQLVGSLINCGIRFPLSLYSKTSSLIFELSPAFQFVMILSFLVCFVLTFGVYLDLTCRSMKLNRTPLDEANRKAYSSQQSSR